MGIVGIVVLSWKKMVEMVTLSGFLNKKSKLFISCP